MTRNSVEAGLKPENSTGFRVNNLFLYAIVVLIWGSTWAAIPYQLGVVDAEVSVGYRFGIAAIALYIYALVSGQRISSD